MEGIERIKTLASEIKDSDLLKIIEYLLSRNDMDGKYLNEEKSLKQMVKFINDTAKSKIDSKRKENGFAGSFFSDEEVYNWAIHYWDEPNSKLGLSTEKPKKIEEQKIVKPQEKEESVEEPIEEAAEESKVEEVTQVEKKEEVKPAKKKKWEPEGQLTLFDFEDVLI